MYTQEMGRPFVRHEHSSRVSIIEQLNRHTLYSASLARGSTVLLCSPKNGPMAAVATTSYLSAASVPVQAWQSTALLPNHTALPAARVHAGGSRGKFPDRRVPRRSRSQNRLDSPSRWRCLCLGETSNREVEAGGVVRRNPKGTSLDWTKDQDEVLVEAAEPCCVPQSTGVGTCTV